MAIPTTAVLRAGWALCTALLAAAPAHADLTGQPVTITESIGSYFLGYGYMGPGATTTTHAVVGAAYEKDWSASGPWMTTALDIDPAKHEIGVYINSFPYGILPEYTPWTFTLDFTALTGERFTGIWAVNHNSALANHGATFTDHTVTLDISGGYYNAINRFGSAPFWAIYQYDTEPVLHAALPAVPEPESYALLLAGLGAMALINRRRRAASHTG